MNKITALMTLESGTILPFMFSLLAIILSQIFGTKSKFFVEKNRIKSSAIPLFLR